MQPAEPTPTRLDAEQYFALVARGDIRPDDRVELLEGVVVSMSPQGSPHANAIARITALLVRSIGSRAVVRVQCSFRAGRYNVPEPDFAVVPGPLERWEHEHPSEALLIIEVSDSSLPTDRLSKAAIYAAAGVPQYLVVNLPGDRIETFAGPDTARARWADMQQAVRGGHIPLVALPGLSLAVDDMLPRR
jgi:Uma2 family endonuclease